MAEFETEVIGNSSGGDLLLKSSPNMVGVITLLVVVLCATIINLLQWLLDPRYDFRQQNWGTVIFSALVAAVVSQVAVNRGQKMSVMAKDETAERERLQGELKHILSSVRCILWHANVINEDGDYLWDTRISLEEAAQRVLPIYVPEGQTFADVWYRCKIKEDSIQCDTNAINAFRTGAAGYRNEYRCLLDSGEIRWFFEDVQVEVLGPNRFYVIGACVDITNVKLAESKLDEERVMLRTLIDALPDMVYIKDIHARFLLSNMAHARYLDARSPDEIAGKTTEELFPPEIARLFIEDESTIFRTGKALVNRTEAMTNKEGLVSWFWTTKVPIRDGQGRITGIVGVSRDITAKKQEEEELKEALQAVSEARKVAEHHAELLEEQKRELSKARDQAIASTKAKSEFLANMSHEIRTPMNGILGITDLMLASRLTKEQFDFARTIRSSADALLTVINDILDFSRIEAGKMHIEITDFNLRTVMEEVTDLVASNAFRKRLEVACLVPRDLPERLKGDPARIRQVLTNLMGNAIKFTEKGEVRLEATLIQETETHSLIRVSVVDTGIGIPKESQSKIFESFTQADGSTTRKYGGTGLGLTISRSLTELMGGRIGMTSVPGKGSTFYVELQFEKQTGAEVSDPAPIPELMAGLRVLIVDDNETNRRVLFEQLSSWGCRPDNAVSGKSCLDMLEHAAQAGDPYQVAIVDMQMPEMDGVQTAIQIKSTDLIKEAVLILYTSIGEVETSEEMRSKGFSAILTKPARQSQLFNVMLSVLGDSQYYNGFTDAVVAVPRVSLGLKVLLAEDNEINQMVAQMMLERFGCEITTVESGMLAVKEIKESDFDVVLMDVHMPDMDGYEATGHIRKFESTRGKRTPIIAMTAKAMPGDREIGLAAGMDDYIVKPVRPDELYRVLKRWSPKKS